jgi:hypothetical protein
MHGAPGSGLARRQRGQVGEIEAAASSHATSCRARHGIEPRRAIEKGAPLAIVRIEVQRPPYALIGRPGIKEMKDLKGRIVSVGGAKDITRIFLERMLITAGVDPKGVDLIFAGATSARYSALGRAKRRHGAEIPGCLLEIDPLARGPREPEGSDRDDGVGEQPQGQRRREGI